MIVFNPYTIPTSLSQLNINLETSLREKDFSHIGLHITNEKEKSEPTLEKIIEAITLPILSYDDVTKENKDNLFKLIFKYFPPFNMTKENQNRLKKFKATIEKPAKKEKPLSFKLSELNSNTGLTIERSLSSEEMLELYNKRSLLSPENRFNTVISPWLCCSDDYAIGQHLQLFLNFLVFEQVAFKINQQETELGFISKEIYNKLFSERNAKSVRLTSIFEAILIDYAEEMKHLDTQELAFCIKMQRKIRIPESIEELKNFSKIFSDKIHKSSNPYFHTLVKFLWKENVLMFSKHVFLLKNLQLKKIFVHYSLSLWGTTYGNEKSKNIMTPDLVYLFDSLANFFNSEFVADNNSFLDFHDEVFAIKRRLNERWKKNQPQQRETFIYFYQKLQEIITKQPKSQKKKFLELKKNLFKIAELPEICFDLQNTEEYFKDENALNQILPLYTKFDQLSQGLGEDLSNLKVESPVEERENDNNALPKIRTKEKKSAAVLTPKKQNDREEKLEPEVNTELEWFKEEAFPYQLAFRVERWEDHPLGASLPPDIFPDYEGKSENYQKKMHIFHRLLPSVNYFLNYGIQEKEKNTLTVKIPADLEYDQIVHRGAITYGIDLERKVCYHKFFTENLESNSQFLKNIFKKSFDNIDFPDLQQSQAILKEKKAKKLSASEVVKINKEWGIATVTNIKEGISIKLIDTTPFL